MPSINDNFADAMEVVIETDGGTYTSPVTNTDANTTEVGEVNTGASDNLSAWWQYTPITTGTATFDTQLTTITTNSTDSYMAIWTGTDFADMVLVAENDDGGGSGTSRIVDLAVTAGTTYWIQIGGFGNAHYNLVLRVVGEATVAAGPDGDVIAVPATATALAVPPVITGAGEITLFPAQPAAIIYDDFDTSSAIPYQQPGALIAAGRANYDSVDFVNAATAGATVLIYLDIVVENNYGRYHDKLFNASEFGAVVPRWPGDWQCNSSGYLADFRVGGVLQSKLEAVLELMVSENPHMGGFFMDDLGTRSFFPLLDWPSFTAVGTNEADYRAGAIAAMQIVREVADRYELMVIVNGTWNDGNGGGYPNFNAHGCSLADGGFIENHSVDAFWTNYSTSAQWGSESPIGADPVMWAESPTDPEIADWEAIVPFVSSQSSYAAAPAPWGTFHYTGLPTGVTTTGSANVAAVAATATATAIPPDVAGNGAANVNAVPATATALVIPPSEVSGESTISGGGPATATAMAHPPVVMGTSEGTTNSNVDAVVATASAVVLIPVVVGTSANANVDAVPATATATTHAPSVSNGIITLYPFGAIGESRQDNAMRRLRTAGFLGSIQDMQRAFLLDQFGGTARHSVADLQIQFAGLDRVYEILPDDVLPGA